jgi:hypothetical protein
MQRNFGKDTIRSGHLYQRFDTCGTLTGRMPKAFCCIRSWTGPWISDSGSGHRLRVVTIDLTQAWREIHSFLIDLISPEGGEVGFGVQPTEENEAIATG